MREDREKFSSTHKLTEEQRAEVVRLYNQKRYTMEHIAKQFGVSVATVSYHGRKAGGSRK